MGAAEAVEVRPVPELLAENALRHGEKLAFVDDRRGVSWAELERRTARLAARLELGRGDRVAFCLDNSVELVEGLLATVRAAAVGAPLSPRGTDAELAALLADCDPAVLVTDQRNLPLIAALEVLGLSGNRIGGSRHADAAVQLGIGAHRRIVAVEAKTAAGPVPPERVIFEGPAERREKLDAAVTLFIGPRVHDRETALGQLPGQLTSARMIAGSGDRTAKEPSPLRT